MGFGWSHNHKLITRQFCWQLHFCGLRRLVLLLITIGGRVLKNWLRFNQCVRRLFLPSHLAYLSGLSLFFQRWLWCWWLFWYMHCLARLSTLISVCIAKRPNNQFTFAVSLLVLLPLLNALNHVDHLLWGFWRAWPKHAAWYLNPAWHLFRLCLEARNFFLGRLADRGWSVGLRRGKFFSYRSIHTHIVVFIWCLVISGCCSWRNKQLLIVVPENPWWRTVAFIILLITAAMTDDECRIT